MHLLVFGATGPSGQAFCKPALRADFVLTIYARNPAKLPEEVAGHRNVTVIKGEFDDVEGLEKAAGCGADVFVSFAGPVVWQSGTPVTDCYRTLFPLLAKHSYRHALVLSTPSHTTSEDKGNMKWYTIITTIKTLVNSMYKEIRATGDYVSNQTYVKWTLFRVPLLGNRGVAKEVKTGGTGDGVTGVFLDRCSLAEWVVGVLKGEHGGLQRWEGQTPLLSDS